MTKINSLTIYPGDKLTIFSEGGDLELNESADNMVVLSVAVGGPPPVQPPPVPGEALAVFTFEPGDFELWERHPAFQQGRSKTHDIPPPAIVGSFDLRMKYDNGRVDKGLFKVGERGVARRTFKVKPGTRTLVLYGVAHDDGVFIVRIIDEDIAGRPAVLSSTGSDYWNENQYLAKFFDFVLQGEHVTVEFDYTAPPLNQESGIKIGYGEIT